MFSGRTRLSVSLRSLIIYLKGDASLNEINMYALSGTFLGSLDAFTGEEPLEEPLNFPIQCMPVIPA